MSFRKVIHDVEEKGLDPSLPHTALGSDGRLLSSVSEPSKVESTVEKEEIQSSLPKNDIVTNITMKKQEVTVTEQEKIVKIEKPSLQKNIKNALKDIAENGDKEADKSTVSKRDNIGEIKTNTVNDDASIPSQKNTNSKKVIKKTKGR